MAEIVPEFTIKEVESFHLHCIYKGKTKQRSVILKNARKICSTHKWKFYNTLQKTSAWVMAETVPDFNTKEVESFCYHLYYIYKEKTKQRSKHLSNPQMRILHPFQKKYICHGGKLLF